MKKLLFISTFIFILTSCGGPSPEEELASAEQQKEELVEVLQTETVELERNKQRLEIIENEISQAETSQSDENVQAYITVIEDYSASLTEELEALGSVIEEIRQEGDVDEADDDIESIIRNIEDTISTYESEVSDIELNETLMRRHNSIQLAHEEIPQALEAIRNGAEDNNLSIIEEGISALNDVSEFY
ncbi:hypothetical protein [Salinicoccus halitifaciens]|uniref:Vacuolar-type H+-ATPase subunit I/STV1 n=1 Tax=Salinicoccus halitifaciens TaxID=1073415 RepID=A0ABV2E7B2_9STAP|nr:hypothetical protein [Salinicoccus halitifaciens]MCD2136906.1 hypothetical protein [Salinicoccus halitifaciens]